MNKQLLVIKAWALNIKKKFTIKYILLGVELENFSIKYEKNRLIEIFQQ